jgi:hypothetical protein
MTGYDTIIDALRAAGRRVIERGGGNATAQCPVPGHGSGNGDRNPSLSIYPRKDGKGTQITCHANPPCDKTDVLAAVNVAEYELIDDPKLRRALNPDAEYRYPNNDVKVRRPLPGGGRKLTWKRRGMTGGTDLYAIEKFPENCPLAHLTESERGAKILSANGAVALGTGGSGRAAHCDFSPLKGVHVRAIVDRDRAGLEWAATVRDKLAGIAASITWVRTPIDKPRASVREHIEADLTLAQLEAFDPFADKRGMRRGSHPSARQTAAVPPRRARAGM